ncbi:MAG TPA: tripartite tricarboxylate transporter substrate-binding protein [Candidatus Limnocylindria bacterium]|nr:tripartite tricarboxylate transporter substrate-binding protein [Candidatus Limnocylindria bacterium]
MSIIVPTDPGGGIDAQARLIEPLLEEKLREISGSDVEVVVQNMPGGAQLIGLEHVWRADPDGMTVLYHITNVMISHQVLGGADVEMREMTPIGRLTLAPTGLIVRKDLELPERSLTGLIERSATQPILIGNVGDPVEIEMVRKLLSDGGLEFATDVVQLDGTSDLIASLLRSEIEVAKTTSAGAIQLVAENPELEFLVTLGCEREEALPEVPSITEEDIPTVADICQSVGQSHRLILGPPGMSEGHAAQLSQAMEQAVNDPAFAEALSATNFSASWEAPEAITSLLEDLIATWEENAAAITD